MQSRNYEITFTGQAGTTLRAEFDDCAVTVGPGTTTLRAELPDQAALVGLVQRTKSIRARVTDRLSFQLDADSNLRQCTLSE